MGTVVPRRRKDGSIAYMAQIAINREGIKHRETKTFDREPVANAWVAKREKELAKPGALTRAAAEKRQPSLAEAIERYTGESLKMIGRTKAQVLASIKSYPIAAKPCADIGSPDIVELAQSLAAKVQPQTVANYLSHLGAVFAIARPAWGYPLDAQAMADAHTVARRLGLTAKSTERDRRPTLDELDRLMTHFREIKSRRSSTAPMDMITAFAMFSTRRLEEIVRIAWADLDTAGSRILVRDMKHPGQKIGNDVWCDLPAPALRIIQAMPHAEARIFPYSTDAVGAAFTRACQFLVIDDLHFHDLRHEGVSRLFEMGLNIPHVAAVSGHRSWQSLKRYTHLRQSGDKYAGWAWLDRIAPVPGPTTAP